MRSNKVFTLTAAMVVAGAAALALAQQRPEGQPGGRGRGGPPGGGFMFGGGTFGANRMSLLRVAEVRKELELADEQVAAIEKIEDELRAKYPSPFGGRGGPGGPGGRGDGQKGPARNNNNEGAVRAAANWYFVQAQNQPANQPGQERRGGQPPSDEDRARFEQQRVERAREEKARLAEVLLPEQLKRLNEIYIQQAGINALQDDDVAKELGISDAQKTKLTEVRQKNQEAFAAAAREMFQGGGGGDGAREANRAKMEEMRKANDAKLLTLLSTDQQKKFEEMKGKPFAMPEGAGRGGPGGPGGNRGRRGGNDNNNSN